jgi:uncharacterized protein YndB with AHSA1/START domain
MTAHDIVREVRIGAPPDEVFPFFTDPDKMIVWKAIEATLDPRPGGIFRINVTGRDIARGQYVEIDPPRRVVFTFGWESENSLVPPGSTTVEITLVPDGDGTRVRLVHSGVPDEIRAGSTVKDGTTTCSGWRWRQKAATQAPIRGVGAANANEERSDR